MSSGYNAKNVAYVNVNVEVGTSSTTVLAANAHRTYLYIKNNAGTDITLTFDGQTPVIGAMGILLEAGDVFAPNTPPTGIIKGIAATSASDIDLIHA